MKTRKKPAKISIECSLSTSDDGLDITLGSLEAIQLARGLLEAIEAMIQGGSRHPSVHLWAKSKRNSRREQFLHCGSKEMFSN
jgi:hypothetical protein